jgi:chemotaxis response regulator CheB
MPRKKDIPPRNLEAAERPQKISSKATLSPSRKKTQTPAKPSRRTPKPKPVPPAPPLVVGVGASAGGLEAFTDLLRHLPRDTGMAFVLLQHLPAKQHSMLAQILSKATVLPVAEARKGSSPKPTTSISSLRARLWKSGMEPCAW